MSGRKRDVIDVREPRAPGQKPTPEQMNHAEYAEQPIYDRSPLGRVSLVGKAYCRVARFEGIEGLTADQLRALRFYRAAYDGAERSETKSALDIRPRGTGSDNAALLRIEQIAGASITLGRIEAGIPAALLGVLRAVAGRDMDFKAVAIDRWGGRDVQRVDATKRKPKVTKSIEPRSGRHRTIIREEFMAAVAYLVLSVTPLMSTARGGGSPGGVEKVRNSHLFGGSEAPQDSEVVTEPALMPPSPVNPAFLDENGHMRPWHEIAGVIRETLTDEAA